MNHTQISYLILTVALISSIILDLFVFSKSNKTVSFRSATLQYLFWAMGAVGFGIYLYSTSGGDTAINYFSAYFMEMALSIDNIFVFVLIFNSLKINEKSIGRVLLIGVMLAIIFRIAFIAIGIILISKFHWLMYVFGAFLIYTGFKLFFENPSEENDVKDGAIYKFIRKYMRYTDEEPNGKFVIQKNGRAFFTRLALVILMIGITDIVFALDSIPAVFAITTENLVVFSSNIFAVMGLRALFFILQKAADKFDFLQQGIAVVLVFIGVKMFLEIIDIHLPVWVSLATIVVCISTSILYSLKYDRAPKK